MGKFTLDALDAACGFLREADIPFAPEDQPAAISASLDLRSRRDELLARPAFGRAILGAWIQSEQRMQLFLLMNDGQAEPMRDRSKLRGRDRQRWSHGRFVRPQSYHEVQIFVDLVRV